MKPIVTRALSGAVYVGVVVAATLIADWTFALLCVLLATLAIIEFERFPSLGLAPRLSLERLDIACAIAIILAAAWSDGGLSIMVPVAVLLLMTRVIAQVYCKDAAPGKALDRSLGALVYVALPLAMLQLVYASASPSVVLLMFVLIWLNDTGAYCVGSAIGRHRLFERISPKKSWEGFFGGMVFSIVCAVAATLLWPLEFPAPLTVAMGVTIPAVATWGDLVESMLKRDAGVKDSGNLMPGHGGILDRIDSLLLVAPWTFVLVAVFS